MPSSRGMGGALACAMCVVGGVLASPAQAGTSPSVGVSIASTTQHDVIAHRLITLKVHPRRGLKLTRVFVSGRPAGKSASTVVATRLREVHLHRHHTTTIHMYLNS